MAEGHREFWQRHPGLVWSNPDADDSVRIRCALLRPRFDRILDIAVEFGLVRVRREWAELEGDDTPEFRRARAPVQRILANIEEGFLRVAAEH
jgi:hypothetical protein